MGWLTLSRNKHEDVIITLPSGEHVTVRVIELRSDKVRLSFLADKSILIHRREVMGKIKEGAA